MLRILLTIIIICSLTVCISVAQKNDFQFIIQKSTEIHPSSEKKIVYSPFSGKSRFTKYNPLSITAKTLLFTYQKLFSVQLSTGCLYSPSCSEYSKQLIYQFGTLNGIIYTADRLMRCSKFAKYDIPQSKYDIHDRKIHESIDYYSTSE